MRVLAGQVRVLAGHVRVLAEQVRVLAGDSNFLNLISSYLFDPAIPTYSCHSHLLLPFPPTPGRGVVHLFRGKSKNAAHLIYPANEFCIFSNKLAGLVTLRGIREVGGGGNRGTWKGET